MKILVIMTGGTIGSSYINNYISPADKSDSLFTDVDAKFDIIKPFTILSEQLDGEYISSIIETVDENLHKGYDGIIITHGTDTLQYTSSALHLAFGNSETPIILVSSNYILTDKRANGKDNFNYAVKFIKEKIGGIFVSYKNTGSNCEIHQGNKLLSHPTFSDYIQSFNKPFGYFEKDKFIKLTDYETSKVIGKYKLNKDSKVVYLKLHPGMVFPEIKNAKGILLESYHSGTAQTMSENFINFCKNSTVPIYLSGGTFGVQYSSTTLYNELKIKAIHNICPIDAYMKIWAATDNCKNIDDFLL